ncbi:hypothetical protein BDW59DRAFT_167973 [Aspergillus cavernicola]|uniref:Uncharacterized protein n=1 Tax=Aspergillus cavernicola TaxID=176166 RepID=A0ABR4H860_9EURO
MPQDGDAHSERSAQDEPEPADKPMSVTLSPTPCPEVDNTHSERSAQDKPKPAVQLTSSTPQTTPMTSNEVLDAEILQLAGEAMISEPGTDPAAQDNLPVPCTCVTNELFLPKDTAAISMHLKLKTLYLMIWAIKDHLAIGQALGLKSTNFNNICQQLAVIAPYTETLIKFKLFIHKNANIAIWFKELNFVINWFKDFHFCHVDSLQTDPCAMLATSGYVDINVYGNSAEQQELHQAALAEANIIWHYTKTMGSTRWPHQFSIVQQILNQDLLYYLLNVCLRPGHPYQLCAYPQPVIDTANLTDSDPEEPFYVPIPLKCRAICFADSLTSYTPLRTEHMNSCDYLLMGVGGTAAAAQQFRDNYTTYLESLGGKLNRRFGHHIDASGLAESKPETYQVQPCPLPEPGHVRFMVPWVPRAHRGTGPRLVLEQTLVFSREAHATDREEFSDAPLDEEENGDKIRVDRGMCLDEVKQNNQKFMPTRNSPWGDAYPCCCISDWTPWTMVRGLSPIADAIMGYCMWSEQEVIAELNILFDPDTANSQRHWNAISYHCHAATAYALAVIKCFWHMEAQMYPDTGFHSNKPNALLDEDWQWAKDRELYENLMPEVGNIHCQRKDTDWVLSTSEKMLLEQEDEGEAEDEGQTAPKPKLKRKRPAPAKGGSRPQKKRRT